VDNTIFISKIAVLERQFVNFLLLHFTWHKKSISIKVLAGILKSLKNGGFLNEEKA